MPMSIPILESWTWPWPVWTLHATYLCSGLLFALHYIPQIRIAWRHPDATRTAQSLSTWSVWTLCRMVGFAYGVYVVHDLFFVLVIGADLLGRFIMVALIVRANLLNRDKTATGATENSARAQRKMSLAPVGQRRLIAYQPKVLVLVCARGS
jgi:hypothetical protein